MEFPETWLPVIGWPRYEVSDLGNVRGAHGPIKTFLVKGYLGFNVATAGGARKSLRVHREVLRAHKGDAPGLQCRHLDGNVLNCRLDNLAWGTQRDNEADKRKHGTVYQGERHHFTIQRKQREAAALAA